MAIAHAMDDISLIIRAVERLPVLVLIAVMLVVSVILRDL